MYCTGGGPRRPQDQVPTDLDWVRRAIATREDWVAVIGFGAQAKAALEELQPAHRVILMPHPIARQWRRSEMDALTQLLILHSHAQAQVQP